MRRSDPLMIRLKITFLYIILIVLSLNISIYWVSLSSNIPAIVLAKNIPGFLFPYPHENGFYGDSAYAYCIFALFILTFLCLIKFLNVFHNIYTLLKKYHVFNIYYTMLAMILVITCLQTIQHTKYFSSIYSRFSTLNDIQKKRHLMGFAYDYAFLCRSYFKEGYYRGKLITDIDISKAVGMTLHRRLAYYLYPIRIRSYRGVEEPDYLIYFQKKDAAALVPKNYVVRLKIDEENLFAIRKGLF